MTEITLGFEVHQPLRLNRVFNEDLVRGRTVAPDELFDIYFNNVWNRGILSRVAKKCYYPSNELMLENIDRYKSEKKKFKLAYSISGVLLEQCELWERDLLDSFKQLAETGLVEFLDQTYYHSLASLYPDRTEFIEQVNNHRQLMKDLLDYKPTFFENTEFIYNNSIGRVVRTLGYKGIFTEGAERILGWRSPNYVYEAKDHDLKVLFRNYQISDDIGFRFSARWWNEWPLTASKYAAWLSSIPGQCINIFIDYETLGEHQWEDTGIFDFMRWLPGEVLNYDNLKFSTPSEVVENHESVGKVDVDDFATVSWADVERDTGAWLSNDMQRTCFEAIKGMERYVKKTGDDYLIKLWRMLQISDHLYYMFIAGGAPGIVHGYFSQQTPVEAFHSFMRILSNFQERVANNLKGKGKESAFLTRVLPPDRAMHYYINGDYTGISAHSLKEFRDTLLLVPPESVYFHLLSGHFERWVRFSIGDQQLADKIRRMQVKNRDMRELQKRLYKAVKDRCSELE